MTFVLLVVACGFFAGLSAALTAVSRFRLRYGADNEGEPAFRRVLVLFEDAQRIQAVSQIGSTLAGVAALAAAILTVRALLGTAGYPLDWRTVALALFVTIPVLLVFGQLVPRRSLRAGRARIIIWLYQPIRLSLAVLGPPASALISLARQIARWRGMRELPADTLAPSEPWQTLLEPEREPSAPGAAEETSETRMIHGIFDLEKTRAREVMRPLVDLVVVHLPEHVGAVCELVRETGYSRFPVYRDRIINLTGYVDIYDILAAEPTDDQPVDRFVREAFYVPETKRLDELLQELLRGRHKVAIVVDEYGGCSGWVTREDLLEEIVGEIEDEFDEASEPIRREDESTWLVQAAVRIDDLNERLGLRLPSVEFDTLAGFVCDTLGRVPQIGDSFEDNEVRYEVVQMDNRRIVSVRIIMPTGPGERPSEGRSQPAETA
jgi:CBS domain containing-hemolysin-like protein